jgi:hypothetical protein
VPARRHVRPSTGGPKARATETLFRWHLNYVSLATLADRAFLLEEPELSLHPDGAIHPRCCAPTPYGAQILPARIRWIFRDEGIGLDEVLPPNRTEGIGCSAASFKRYAIFQGGLNLVAQYRTRPKQAQQRCFSAIRSCPREPVFTAMGRQVTKRRSGLIEHVEEHQIDLRRNGRIISDNESPTTIGPRAYRLGLSRRSRSRCRMRAPPKRVVTRALTLYVLARRRAAGGSMVVGRQRTSSEISICQYVKNSA